MAILQQIKSDAAYLRDLLLKNKQPKDKTKDICVTGEQLEAEALIRKLQIAQLKKLDIILDSQVIPNKYYSCITKQTYYPSTEELKEQSKACLAAQYSFFCIKNSRKKTQLSNSIFKLIRDDTSSILRFFMEHKNNKAYPKGSYALKIKKGFLFDNLDKPKYAVKVYNHNLFPDDTVHELRIAMRAAYCYKQLGREGYAFRRNQKQYLITDWLQGQDLILEDPKKIQSIPISRRIVMAISLLRELSILHRQGLIHNDIKPENVMVAKGKLCFVDLDSVRPKFEEPLYGCTPVYTKLYLPNAQMAYDAEYFPEELYLKFNEQTDMYAMGITLSFLFPEIYIPKYNPQHANVNGSSTPNFIFNTMTLYQGPNYTAHQRLQKIIRNMSLQQNSGLSSADDYIEALYEILPQYPEYNKYIKEDRLLEIELETSCTDGEKAFRDIEIELLQYAQRSEIMNKLLL